MKNLLFIITLFLFQTNIAGASQGSKFIGQWNTSYGVMSLKAEGKKLKGTYGVSGEVSITGSIEGHLEKNGNKFIFNYSEKYEKGEGWFQISSDGKRFSGMWKEDGQQVWLPWYGERQDAKEQGLNFSGVWVLKESRIRFIEKEGQVIGISNDSEEGVYSGKRDNNKLEFKFKSPSSQGDGWIELSKDGQSFSGKYKDGKSTKWEDFSGQRLNPVVGWRWLVVIESHWEDSLDDKDYSFGNMLKSYFSPHSNVHVRQRIFSDERSLKKWLREVSFLPERVTIAVASHGEEDGVSVGSHRIGPKVIAEGLEYAPNVELLHFSACLVMKSKMGQEILDMLKYKSPVSGYKTSVDWGLSAIVEFMYFDLMLTRGYSPEMAAETLLKQMPVAGDKATKGAPFAPLGFSILKP